MNTKNDVEVIINGRKYKLCGYESDAYLQSIAAYLNQKYDSLKSMETYHRMDSDLRNALLEINVADDYFKAKSQAERLDEELKRKNNELFDIKHDIIGMQSKLDSTLKDMQVLKFEHIEAQKKIVKLETELEERERREQDALKLAKRVKQMEAKLRESKEAMGGLDGGEDKESAESKASYDPKPQPAQPAISLSSNRDSASSVASVEEKQIVVVTENSRTLQETRVEERFPSFVELEHSSLYDSCGKNDDAKTESAAALAAIQDSGIGSDGPEDGEAGAETDEIKETNETNDANETYGTKEPVHSTGADPSARFCEAGDLAEVSEEMQKKQEQNSIMQNYHKPVSRKKRLYISGWKPEWRL